MATLKMLYANAVALTMTLAALATSSTRVVGRESTAVSNAVNKYLDAVVSGKITTGTSPTAGFIDVWIYWAKNETPDYPDVLDGTDSDETFSDENSRNSAMRLGAVIAVDTTSDQTYHFSFSIRQVLGFMPIHWGVFIAHNSGVNLNATGGNHKLEYVGVHLESV